MYFRAIHHSQQRLPKEENDTEKEREEASVFIDRGACNTWRDSGCDGGCGGGGRWRRRQSTRLQFLHLFAQHRRRPPLRYVWRRLPSRFTPLMYTLTRCQCLCIIYAVCQPGKAALSVDGCRALSRMARAMLLFALTKTWYLRCISKHERPFIEINWLILLITPVCEFILWIFVHCLNEQKIRPKQNAF